MRLFFEQALIGNEWRRNVRIVATGGCIERIEEAAPQSGDERHAIGLSGLGNVHSHAFQRGMAGLAEARGASDDNFWTWRETMYRFVGQIGPDELEAIAALAYMEMLESGFTRVGEFHYLHNDLAGQAYADPAQMGAAIVAAAEATGIGLTLLPVFYAHAGFDGAPLGEGQRRFAKDTDTFENLMTATRRVVKALPDPVVGVAPHSLRAVAAEEFATILPLAEGGPIHIHIAEQWKEVVDCLAARGARPVDWLMDHAPVDHRWCLVHATHMTPEETSRLAASGAVAGLCPITEANLGDGLFPATAFLKAGGKIAVGSDSNVLIDAAEELRLLEYGQRLRGLSRNVLSSRARTSTGARLFGEALVGGAQATAGARGIAVGQSADIVSLDADHPSLVGRQGDALLDSWIFAARGGAVSSVWRRGEKVVEHGRHRAREHIGTRYQAAMAKLLQT